MARKLKPHNAPHYFDHGERVLRVRRCGVYGGGVSLWFFFSQTGGEEFALEREEAAQLGAMLTAYAAEEPEVYCVECTLAFKSDRTVGEAYSCAKCGQWWEQTAHNSAEKIDPPGI